MRTTLSGSQGVRTVPRRVERLIPPGFDARTEWMRFHAFVGCAALLGLIWFLGAYMNGHANMFTLVGERRVENPSAEFPAFAVLMLGGLIAFGVASIAFLWLLFRYVSYHYRGGTRAAYTMRRLPRRWEFALRCGALPAGGLVACQICWRVLALLCGLIYAFTTPERWLPPDAWGEVLRLATL